MTYQPMDLVQRMVTPPDEEGRCLELVLARSGATFVWSARIDGWTSVAAAGWHSLDALRSLAAVVSQPAPQDIAIADDIAVRIEGGSRFATVTVTSETRLTMSASEHVSGLSSAARILLDRAESDRSRPDVRSDD